MIRHETVQANGLSFHCARVGEGPLMLFLHGFPEYWAMWQPMLEHFGARGWCAVAPDLRGYNRSDKPATVEDYRPKHLMADVLALAAHYTQDRFVLVAHDWGGAVAWGVAIAQPQRLAKLVMLNSPHPYLFWRELCGNPAQQKASEYMNFFRLPKAERVLSENGYARLLGAFADLDEEARVRFVREWGDKIVDDVRRTLESIKAVLEAQPARAGEREGGEAHGKGFGMARAAPQA